MTDEILLDAEERMESAVAAAARELQGLRTGRASTALVENLQVDAYGAKMPLIQLANLATPEAQLIAITPFDKATVDAIMKAIQQSDIGITPNSDGRIIRLPIPPLTEQRRKELVKQVHAKTEDGRIAIRFHGLWSFCSPASRSRSSTRVIRKPVSVRKKYSPISKGRGPRHSGGAQCSHITPSTAKARQPSSWVFRGADKTRRRCQAGRVITGKKSESGAAGWHELHLLLPGDSELGSGHWNLKIIANPRN